MYKHKELTFNLKEDTEISSGDALLYVSDDHNAELVSFVRHELAWAIVRKYDGSELKLELKYLWQVDDPSHRSVVCAWLDVLMRRQKQFRQPTSLSVTLQLDEQDVILEIPPQIPGLWRVNFAERVFTSRPRTSVVGIGEIKEAILAAPANHELDATVVRT